MRRLRPSLAVRTLLVAVTVIACAPDSSQDAAAPVPSYRVVSDTGYETPGKLEADRILVVEAPFDSAGLHRLAVSQLDSLRQRGPGRWHERPTVASVFIYDSEVKALAGEGQFIARAVLTSTRAEPEIQVQGSVLAAQAEPLPAIGGLAEPKLQEAWTALVRAEDRATAEAQQRYPELDPLTPGYSGDAFMAQLRRQTTLQDSLTTKYRAQVGQRFGLSPAQLDSIAVVAFQRQWIMPSR